MGIIHNYPVDDFNVVVNGFYHLIQKRIELIPKVNAIENYFKGLYKNMQINVDDIKYDQANWKLVFENIKLTNINPLKPLTANEFIAATSNPNLPHNPLSSIEREFLTVDLYPVVEQESITMREVWGLRQNLMSSENNINNLNKSFIELMDLLSNKFALEIMNLRNWIFFEMLVNGRVVLRNIGTNYELTLGSATNITDITSQVSNRAWTGSDNPLIAIRDAIRVLKNQSFYGRFNPHSKFYVLMNEITAINLINNTQFRQYLQNYKISSYEKMIDVVSAPSSEPIREFLVIQPDNIVLCSVSYDIVKANNLGNTTIERAIPTGVVVVLIPYPDNFVIGMTALPYFDSKTGKITKENKMFSVKLIPARTDGHIQAMLLEFVTSITGVLRFPELVARFTTT